MPSITHRHHHCAAAANQQAKTRLDFINLAVKRPRPFRVQTDRVAAFEHLNNRFHGFKSDLFLVDRNRVKPVDQHPPKADEQGVPAAHNTADDAASPGTASDRKSSGDCSAAAPRRRAENSPCRTRSRDTSAHTSPTEINRPNSCQRRRIHPSLFFTSAI